MNQETKVNILEKDYLDDLTKIKLTIKSNQAQAMVIVNRTMILTYYQIGKIINQRKKEMGKQIYRKIINRFKGLWKRIFRSKFKIYV